MIVERLHIQITIDGQLAIVGNGVTKIGAILQFRTTLPCIVGRIVGIGCQPVQNRQLVQWELIRGRKGLTIVERRTKALDAMPYRILPGTITVGIEVLVDGQTIAVRFLNFGTRTRLEVHVQVLGQVPAEREVTIPQERRTPLHRNLGAGQVVHVALLQLVIRA